MKPSILLLLILFSWSLIMQAQDREYIREAEAKAASARMLGIRNMNTNNYDLKYHRLELNVDPTQSHISGTVTSHFKAKSDMNTIVFELVSNMMVSDVKQRGIPLSFTQNNNDEVVISLPQLQQKGVLDSLSISYSGNPVSSGFGSFEIDTHNGDPVLWTLSEPYGAKAWWPCKQDLIDKVDSIDFYITTPKFSPNNKEYIAVANGVEMSQTDHGNYKTTHYKHQYPIPAYLMAIAVTNYAVYSHTVPNNGSPFEIINYVYPEDLSYAQQRTPVTVDIMELFGNLFEPYPYASEKYGHAQMGWGGGMEHTTVSFMGGLSRGLIAHELGHQWFGDKVTCGSWQDVWLNEGFATYMEGLVIEHLDGSYNFRTWRHNQINSATSYPGGSVYIPASDTVSVNRIFNGRLTYDKSSMVLHMLRRKLGDSLFFLGARNYLNDPALTFGYAKTPDLKRNMETVSGQNLSTFFDSWVYGEGYPNYNITWNQENNGNVHIKINQTPSVSTASFFEARIPLRFRGSQGEWYEINLDNTQNGQRFLVPVGFTVQSVEFDPNHEIISGNNSIALGTGGYGLEKKIKLYPNPTTGLVKISKPNSVAIRQIRVYNSIGQMLYATSADGIVDISKFSAGMFIFEIETDKGTIHSSIIKK